MKTRSVFKTLVLLFLIAVMCFPVGVFAANDTGSISFTAQTTGDHEIVPDAEFELYKVADYDVSSITLTQGFSGMNLKLLDLQDHLKESVETVEAWLSNHSVSPVTSVVSGTDGKVTFSNLSDGVYLVKYKDDAAKNKQYNRVVTAESVLLAIPYISGNDLLRTVTITPKISVHVLTEPVSVSVTKKWDDGNSSKRPTSVDAVLYQDGKVMSTITLNASNSWTYVWKSLDGGHTYDVKEDNVPSGYKATISKNGDYDFVITNKSDSTPPGPSDKPVSVSVKKVWVDNQNNSSSNSAQGQTNNSRPASIQVQLYNGGSAVGQAVNLSDANNWSYVWNNLDAKGSYDVKEVNIPTGYDSKVEKSANGSNVAVTITNTRVAPIDITVTKVWVGDTPAKDNGTTQQNATTPANQDVRPTSVQVQLYNGDSAVGQAVTLSEANQWTYTWKGVDSNGSYDVKEVNAPSGYKVEVKKEAGQNNGIKFTVTNTKVQPIDLQANKVWDDGDNKDRPLSVTLQLYNGQQKVGDPVTLSAGNNWTYSWKSLAGDGEWSVQELNPPKDYKVSYERKGNTIIVTNKFDPTTWTDVVTGDDFAWLRYSILALVLVGAGVGGLFYVKKRRKDQAE